MPTKYQILRMETIGTPPLMERGMPLQYNDPAIAAHLARDYSKIMGEKLCVKAVITDEWRQREEARMNNGEYRPLPWAGRAWWDACYPIWKDHYPHASLEKPGWIAFTKSEEDGAKDKQTLLRPGAYLSRYCEREMERYGVRDRTLVEEFMKMYGPIDIKFATTNEEVIKIYDALQTCMAGKRWPKNIHPATLYLAGDLQIAYLGDLDKGRVGGRALVWPERKLHSRIYGDIARMTQGLHRLGYKWGAPIGAKIKRVQLHAVTFEGGRAAAGCFLLPYIDKKNQAGGGHLSVKDTGDHLVICEEGEPGSHHAGQADGTSGLYVPREDEVPTYTCDHCGRNKLRKVYQVFDCVAEDGGEGEPLMWCDECFNENSVNCGYSGNYYTDDVKMVEVNGDNWAEYYANMYAAKCQGNGKLYSKNNLYAVYSSATEYRKLSMEYVEEHIGHIYRSGLTDRYLAKDDVAYFYNSDSERNRCAKWELKTRAFQCDGCDQHHLIQYRHQHFGDDRLFCRECTYKILGGKTPVSPSRKQFEIERDQIRLPLQAAE